MLIFPTGNSSFQKNNEGNYPKKLETDLLSKEQLEHQMYEGVNHGRIPLSTRIVNEYSVKINGGCAASSVS